jgi:outer membrane protein assembly factor BamD
MRRSTPKRSVRGLVLIIAVVVATGCSSDKVKVAPPDELYRQATQDFVEGNYGISIQTYKYLLDHYPLDERAEDIELRIAEAHFADGAYPEAIAAYTDFQRMHPTSPRLAEVEFKIGMAYVGQMDTIDRDLNAAASAHARFESVIARYPNSDYAQRARDELKAVREHLAARELYVARFYVKQGNHAAARTRVGTLLVTYPETESAAEAIALIAADARAAGDEDLAQIADAAHAEAVANQGSTRPGSAVQTLQAKIAPNAVAARITPIAPPSGSKGASKPL